MPDGLADCQEESRELRQPAPSGLAYWRRLLPVPVRQSLIRSYWRWRGLRNELQDYTAELVGGIPVHSLRLWWYRRACGVEIGSNSSIHRHCRFYAPFRVTIGHNSVVNYGVVLDGRSGLTIGDNVSISEGTVILTLGHDVDDPDFSLKGGRAVIEDYVFVGACARILPGVRIGEGAVVAAGSVVTKDVAPYTMVAGAPARYVRDRSHDLRYQLKYRKRFG